MNGDGIETLPNTPRQDGFHMPGEFEAHAGCWMLWPERPDTWRENARPAQAAFARVAAAIAAFEPVTVGTSAGQVKNARQLLPPHLCIIELPSDDAWMRDIGPTFVLNEAGEVRGVDWDFNAWGVPLYPSWKQDTLVARRVLESIRLKRYQTPGFVLEGGSILADGQGTLLTTEECLLNPNRNPGLDKSIIEEYLGEYLGIEQVIWLGKGIPNDETSGHIDNLCTFVRPGVVVLAWSDQPGDPFYEICRDALERLLTAFDAHGRRLEVHKLNQPAPMWISAVERQGMQIQAGAFSRRSGQPLAASYINFYLPNGGVIVPTFDQTADIMAMRKLQELFPLRKVVGVPGREILLGGGNIHCITLHQPRFVGQAV